MEVALGSDGLTGFSTEGMVYGGPKVSYTLPEVARATGESPEVLRLAGPRWKRTYLGELGEQQAVSKG